MAKRSAYQQRVIRNYYNNQDAIMLQRLGDLITDLYLAEGKSRVRLWKRVATTLEKLGVSGPKVQRLVQSDNPSLVADELKRLLSEK